MTVSYADERRAGAIAESLTMEAGEIGGDRSRTDIDRTGSTVALEIRAADLTALRAAVNTWFTLVDVAESAYALGVDGSTSGESRP